MLQNCVNLLPGDTRKPLEEVVNGRAVLKILEQSAHGNARAFEDPCAAEFPRLLFHYRTAIPLRIHGVIIPRSVSDLKSFLSPVAHSDESGH